MKHYIDIDFFHEIWQSISRNKVRSILTGFGVGWGILMFILMSGIGNGFKNGILYGITGFPQNSMYVFTNSTTKKYKGFNEGRQWSIDNSDIKMLKDNISNIEHVCGIVFTPGLSTFTNKDKSATYNMKGVDDTYKYMEPYTIMYGRNINPIDIQEKRKVCMLGQKIYHQLFQTNENPVGKLISINNSFYTVVGVMRGSNQININGNINSSAFVPLTTIQQSYNYGSTIHMLAINTYKNVDIKKIEKQVTTLLKNKHNISPDDDEAINVFDISQLFKAFNNLFVGLDILIWIVGMGTLLAGIIGITNIMLVSIKERTSEIGIRRALGAKPKSILWQILSESVLLTTISGFIGLFISSAILVVLNKAMSAMPQNEDSFFADPSISFNLALTAMIILLVSGLIAGIIPAKKALNIKAIDALRDE